MEKEELIATLDPVLIQLTVVVEKFFAMIESFGLSDNPIGWIILLAVFSGVFKFAGSMIVGVCELIFGIFHMIIKTICLPWTFGKFAWQQYHRPTNRAKDPLGEYQEMEFGESFIPNKPESCLPFEELDRPQLPKDPSESRKKVKKTTTDDDLATSLKRNLLDD